MRNLGEKGKAVSHEENMMLAKKVREGDPRAREKMIMNNIGLAYYHSLRVAEVNKLKYQISGDDIFQAATIGLIRAVDKFNPDLGFKFSTYAHWWIRMQIGEELVAAHWTTMRPPKVSAEEYILYRSGRISEEERDEYERRYVWSADDTRAEDAEDITDFTEIVHIMEAAEECLDEQELELFCTLYSVSQTHAGSLAETMGLTNREARTIEERCIEKIREHIHR